MRKKLISAAVCLLATMSGMAQTGDRVYVNDFSVMSGGSVAVGVNMSNPENTFCAFQFDLLLPDGITVGLNKKGKLDVKLNEDRKDDDHTLTVEQIETGRYRFVCFSMSNAAFYENDGAVVDLTIAASSAAGGGALTGSIENVVLTKTDRSDVKPDDTTFSITVVTETGIAPIGSAQQQAGEAYDLQGRRVVQPARKGLFIRNGRKELAK